MAFPKKSVVLLANDKTVTVDTDATGQELRLQPGGVLEVLDRRPTASLAADRVALYTWGPTAWLSVRPADG